MTEKFATTVVPSRTRMVVSPRERLCVVACTRTVVGVFESATLVAERTRPAAFGDACRGHRQRARVCREPQRRRVDPSGATRNPSPAELPASEIKTALSSSLGSRPPTLHLARDQALHLQRFARSFLGSGAPWRVKLGGSTFAEEHKASTNEGEVQRQGLKSCPKLDPGAFSSPSGTRTFRVVEANSNPPAPPLIEVLDYSVMGSSAEARFRFAPFQGLLVKDVGAHGAASLAAIDVSHVSEGGDPRPFVRLARRPCMENFAAQPGGSTILRFGVFDLAANFSGWGKTRDVPFPATDTAAESTGADEDAEDGGCALGAPGRGSSPGAWLVLTCVALRRLWR